MDWRKLALVTLVLLLAACDPGVASTGEVVDYEFDPGGCVMKYQYNIALGQMMPVTECMSDHYYVVVETEGDRVWVKVDHKTFDQLEIGDSLAYQRSEDGSDGWLE